MKYGSIRIVRVRFVHYPSGAATISSMRPNGPPLGLLLATTSKAVGRAFNNALAEGGGSIPIWLILNALKSEPRRTQLDLARAVGIEGPHPDPSPRRHGAGRTRTATTRHTRPTRSPGRTDTRWPRAARPPPEVRDQLQPTATSRPQQRGCGNTEKPAPPAARQRRAAGDDRSTQLDHCLAPTAVLGRRRLTE